MGVANIQSHDYADGESPNVLKSVDTTTDKNQMQEPSRKEIGVGSSYAIDSSMQVAAMRSSNDDTVAEQKVAQEQHIVSKTEEDTKIESKAVEDLVFNERGEPVTSRNEERKTKYQAISEQII